MLLVLRDTLEELRRLIDAVETFSAEHAIPEGAAFRLHLVVEELFVNVARYAFDPPGHHQIDVRLELETPPPVAGQPAAQPSLVIEMADGGTPFNPLEKERPDLDASVTDRRIGGLGVELVRQLAKDQITYRRENDRNHLHVRLCLADE